MTADEGIKNNGISDKMNMKKSLFPTKTFFSGREGECEEPLCLKGFLLHFTLENNQGTPAGGTEVQWGHQQDTQTYTQVVLNTTRYGSRPTNYLPFLISLNKQT